MLSILLITGFVLNTFLVYIHFNIIYFDNLIITQILTIGK